MQTPPPANSSIEVRTSDGATQYDFPVGGLQWYFIGLLLVGIVGLGACAEQWGAILGFWPGDILDISGKNRVLITGIFLLLSGVCVLGILGRWRIVSSIYSITKQLRFLGIPILKLTIPWESISQIDVGLDSGGDPVMWLRQKQGESVIFETFRTAEERDWFRDSLETHRKIASGNKNI